MHGTEQCLTTVSYQAIMAYMLLRISPDMPQLQNLQNVEALRQAKSHSTSRVLIISRLRHVRTDLQY